APMPSDYQLVVDANEARRVREFLTRRAGQQLSCPSVWECRLSGRCAAVLHVFVQQLTCDAPTPICVTMPDHEEASPGSRTIRALRPAHPAPTALGRCEIPRPDGGVGDDLHRGDHNRRCGG